MRFPHHTAPQSGQDTGEMAPGEWYPRDLFAVSRRFSAYQHFVSREEPVFGHNKRIISPDNTRTVMPRVHFTALSERGLREINEDSYCAERIGNYYVFGIADGLSGHAAGRIASDIAISCLKDAFKGSPETPAMALESAVRTADAQIRSPAEEFRERSGMATKLIAAAVDDELNCTVLDIDNRSIDIVRTGGIKTTTDPSVIKKPARADTTPPGTVRHHSLSDMISHVLGEPQMIDKTGFTEMSIRDSFLLLSSDGLHDYIGKDAIREIIIKNGDNLETSSEELVQKALSADSDGTITVVLVHGHGD